MKECCPLKTRRAKLKKYRCTRKERLTNINQLQSVFAKISVPFLGRNPVPKTLCEKKQWAYTQKQFDDYNKKYIKPWQQCLKKKKCL
jgi:hypothetical protein